MALATDPSRPRETAITVETRLGTDIPNHQPLEFSEQDRSMCRQFDHKFPDAISRTNPISVYNCHGLVFASRRTWICEGSSVMTILEDDGYEEIPETEALPGDVIVYFDEDGDPDHSGVLLDWSKGKPRIPLVLSKWGKFREVIHWGNYGPYPQLSQARYYRVIHGADKIIEHGRVGMAIPRSQHSKVSVQAFSSGIIRPGA